MNKLTETQKAYMAGFIDGEGCICIFRTRDKRLNGYVSYQPVVRVSNTDVAVLNTLREWSGIGLVRTQSIKRSNPSFTVNCKPQWKWQINASDMRKFLPSILPYLQVKKAVVELVIEFLGDKPRVRGRHVSDGDIAKWEETVTKLNALNKRGLGVSV